MSLSLPHSLYEFVEDAARQNGRSMSATVRIMAKRYYDNCFELHLLDAPKPLTLHCQAHGLRRGLTTNTTLPQYLYEFVERVTWRNEQSMSATVRLMIEWCYNQETMQGAAYDKTPT